uniref:Retinol dehydrogenase 12 n=1 Tax=Caligus clemensi TaxID=344056 RepID=C1C324_CALCM|nr:Retinol dehydrogenase 12 [Caligus clemensi]
MVLSDELLSWPAVSIGLLGGGVLFLYAVRRSFSRKWGRYSLREMDDVKGKTIIITGANTGLGYDAALKLAEKNPKLILACRNAEKGNKAVQNIIQLSGYTDVHFMELDLSSLKSVETFAGKFLEEHDKLDVLLCNAGVWSPMDQKKKSQDGFEIHFGVNHLGHHYLVSLLKDRIMESSGRIVMVSSLLMLHGKVDMESKNFVEEGRPQEGRSWVPTGYADSKIMNGLMAKQYAAAGLKALAICPGWCKTELARYVPLTCWKKFVMFLVSSVFQRSSSAGSENLVFAAVTKEFENGGFYRECRIAQKEMDKLNALTEVGNQLHSLSDELITSKINA